MANPPSDLQAAKRRASFARTDRLRREAGPDRPKPRKADPARAPNRSADLKAALRQKRDHMIKNLDATPKLQALIKKMYAGYEQSIDRNDAVRARLDQVNAQRQQSQSTNKPAPARQQRSNEGKASQARQDRSRTDGARRDEQRRTDRARQDETKQALQRAADDRQRQAKRAAERRRVQIRQEFAAKAERRRDAQQRAVHERRQAMLREASRKAAADIEREHKRQREERQASQRRETDMTRARHRMERDSFRRNELAIAERHHGAMKRLDAAEQRELGELVARQKGLAGRVASLVPGTAKKHEEEQQAVRDRYESERLTKHRDLEASKERQFQAEQNTRINQAQERLGLMRSHRDSRLELERDQSAGFQQQTETRRDAIVAAQEQQVREHEQSKEAAPAREASPPPDLSQEFQRSR